MHGLVGQTRSYSFDRVLSLGQTNVIYQYTHISESLSFVDTVIAKTDRARDWSRISAV